MADQKAAQEEWHFAYLGMEYRHTGRKADCEACANWKLPQPERPYEHVLSDDTEPGDLG
jgi:hypothetical protein